MNKYALILAGGKGTRLWPLSRENHPKQFIEFKDGLSLFQLSIKRALSFFAASDIFIIAGLPYKFTLYNQIELYKGLSPAIKKILKANIIFEPQAKNTLPAILLALKSIEHRARVADDDQFYVFPSDQIIEPVSIYKKCMSDASHLAATNRIVVFGVKPDSPKVGFGYVLVKKQISRGYVVDRFVEKPAKAMAQALIKKGAFWNAGIFCFNKGTFLRELGFYQPKFFDFYQKKYDEFLKNFSSVNGISIDYGIMQQTKSVGLVAFHLRWSDLGSWDSYSQYQGTDVKNYHVGDVAFLDSKNCFAYSGSRLMCLVGLEDVIAVDSSDSLLLMKKGHSDKVRELVSVINKRKDTRTKDSATVYRPWGYYMVLIDSKNYKVKEIGVYPKKTVALQKHKFRSEHWNVVEGVIEVIVDKHVKRVFSNQSVFVPRNTKHTIHNPTKKLAKFIEVQIGSYLGEDDIVRYGTYE